MVKEFLSQQGIRYEVRDVSSNRAYAEELVRNTRQMGVPVTIFNGQTVIGYDRPRLEQMVRMAQSGQRPSFGASVADAAAITANRGDRIISGAFIGAVRPGSVAARTGLIQNDIITHLDTTPISTAADLQSALSSMSGRNRFSVTFLRGGETRTAQGSF